jgi:hypothetical protein
VSVPSHCPLLDAPAKVLAEAFATVPLKTPVLGYLSGSRARMVTNIEALRDDLAFNMCRVVDWRGTVQSAYERGVRLQIELPPGAVLTGLARRVFEAGHRHAFDGARLDTLQALLREEEAANPKSLTQASNNKNNIRRCTLRTTTMIIYGVAFLAICTLTGIFIGELLGKLLGVPANVGGVGIAMLLLIWARQLSQQKRLVQG